MFEPLFSHSLTLPVTKLHNFTTVQCKLHNLSFITAISHLQLHKYGITTRSIKPADAVRDLGVLLVSSFSMEHHIISSITKFWFFHLRCIRQARICLNEEMSPHPNSGPGYLQTWLLQLSPLWPSCIHPPTTNHCFPLCYKAHQKFVSTWSENVTHTLRELHWLHIQTRINFKICLLKYWVHTNSSPSYVSSLVTPCSSLQSRRSLRSSSQADFVVTRSLRKFGNRGCALAGPANWNKLPNFIRKSASLSPSKINLKIIHFV